MKMIEIEKCDHIICLGDILGYPFKRARYEDTRNADECINIIKSNCSIVTLGNHDLYHLQKFPEFSSGFKFPKNWYNLSAEEKSALSGSHVWNYSDDYAVKIQDSNKAYLLSLPEYVIKEFGDKRILFSHFIFPSFSGYIASYYGEGKKMKEHFNFMKKESCELSLCAHMHIEGLGICYKNNDNLLSHLIKGFIYYSYGEKKIKHNNCCVTLPALADNGQVNGFAIYNHKTNTINAVSININRRFIL